MAKKLQEEIKQRRPFDTLEAEAILNLQRTADRLHRTFQQLLKPFGLTATQYNALRILRGAGSGGLTCGEIGERLVSHDPDITRLLNRLERQGLVERQRDDRDKRAIYTRIRTTGLELLAELDPVVTNAGRRMIGHLGQERLTSFIDLLEEAREKCG
jgi:DNA-binding MarR family transcriptional regulator